MSKQWQQLSSRIVYSNPWIKVREDKIMRPSGKEGMYSVIENSNAVMMVALSTQNEVCLISLHRYPIGDYVWELPVGGIDEDSTPLAAAQRELQEETGLISKEWEEMGFIYMNTGITNQKVFMFLCRNCEQQELDQAGIVDDGIQAIKTLPFPTILQMIKDNEITNCQSIATLMQAALRLGLLDSQDSSTR